MTTITHVLVTILSIAVDMIITLIIILIILLIIIIKHGSKILKLSGKSEAVTVTIKDDVLGFCCIFSSSGLGKTLLPF